MSVPSIFAGSRRELRGKQVRVWTQAIQDLELDLDPYDCKASYVCGVLRQFIEAGGLQLASQYHVGALVAAASAFGSLRSASRTCFPTPTRRAMA